MVYIEKVKIKIGIFSGGQKQATQHYDEKDDMIDYDDNKEDYDYDVAADDDVDQWQL